jgi:hypothetical protein
MPRTQLMGIMTESGLKLQEMSFRRVSMCVAPTP